MINLSFFTERSKREKVIALVTVAVAILFFGDYLIVQPIKNKVTDHESSIITSERRIEKNNRILGLKDDITAQFENNSAFVKMSGSDEEELGKFLNEIEVLSRKSEVSLIDMKPHIARSNNPSLYKSYYVETETEASVENIIKFMHNLQKSKQLLTIEKFSLNTKGEAISEVLKAYITITKIVVVP